MHAYLSGSADWANILPKDDHFTQYALHQATKTAARLQWKHAYPHTCWRIYTLQIDTHARLHQWLHLWVF